jgi:hypothetical protein
VTIQRTRFSRIEGVRDFEGFVDLVDQYRAALTSFLHEAWGGKDTKESLALVVETQADLIAEGVELHKRIAELEAGLRDKDWSLAETLCVVLSHEGHIAALEDINSDLVDALDAVMQKYSNVPLVPWDETALTEEEWIEETSADRKAIAALAKTREKVMG